MGESYRGLTIRIGADTSNLARALKSVNRDASNAQSALRKINQALRMDPSSMTAVNAKIRLLNVQAAQAATKLRTLERSVSQMKADGIEATRRSLSEMGVTVGSATERYNALDKRIEQIKRTYLDLYKQAAKTNSELDGKVKYSAFKDWDMSHVVSQLKEAGIEASASGEKIDDLLAKYKSLSGQHADAQSQLADATRVAQYEDALAQIEKQRAEVRKLASDYVQLRAAQAGTQGSGFRKAAEELERMDSAAGTLKQRLSTLDRALELDPSNMAAAVLRMENLSQQEQIAKQRCEELRAQLRSLDSQGAGKTAANTSNLTIALERAKSAAVSAGESMAALKSKARVALQELSMTKASGAGASQVKAASDAFDSAAAKVREYASTVKEARSDVDRLAAAQKRVGVSTDLASEQSNLAGIRSQMSKTGSVAKSMYSNMTNIGLSLSTTLTPAATMFGNYAVQAANDIDTSYRNMRKTVQGSEQQFEDLKQSAMDYSKTHFTSADQLLEIQAMGGQLGIATKDLDTFSKVISNINIATNITDAETAAQQLGQLASITHMDSREFTSFSDSLTRLGNNNAALEDDIMDITMRIASQSNIIGMSTSDILAWSTALAATGQKRESAGTAFAKTEAMIEGAVANGSKAVKGYAKVADMSADEFVQAWKSNPTDALKAFIMGLKQIDDKGGSVEKTLSGLDINSVRQKQAIEGLVQTIGGLNDDVKMSKDAWDGVGDKWGQAGDAAREAQRKTEGFSGQLQQLKNNGQVFAANVADEIAPALGNLNGIISTLNSAWDSLDDTQKNVIIAFGGMSATIGPALTLLGAMGPALQKGASSISALRAAISIVASRNVDTAATFKAMMSSADGSAAVIGKAGNAMEAAGRKAAAMGSLARIAAAGVNVLKISFATLAPVLAVSAIALAVQKFQEMKEHADKVSKAEYGMRDAISAASSAANDGVPPTSKLSGATKTLQQAIDDANGSHDNFLQRQSDLVDSTDQAVSSFEEEVGPLNEAEGAISRFANKSELSADSQARLRGAIALVNESCGTQYKVVDAANGKISDADGKYSSAAGAADRYKESILKAIEAKKQEARTEMETQALKNAYSAYSSAQEDYNQQLLAQRRIQAQIEADKRMMQSTTNPLEFQSAETDLNNLQVQLNSTNAAVNEAKTSMDSAKQGVDNATASFDAQAKAAAGTSTAWDRLKASTGIAQNLQDAGASFDTLKSAMGEVGMKASQVMAIADNSPNEAAKITQAWDGTSQGLVQNALVMMGANEDVSYALANSGIKWQTFAAIGKQSFQSMVDYCNGDTNKMIEYLNKVNGQKLKGKRLIFTQNGFEAVSAKVSGINGKKIKNKTVVFGAKGVSKVLDETGNIDDKATKAMKGRKLVLTATGHVKVLNATDKIKKGEQEIKDGSIKIDDKGTAKLVSGRLDEVNKKSKDEKKNVDVNVSGNANEELDKISGKINGLSGKDVDVNVWFHAKGDQKAIEHSARGHVFTKASSLNMPRFAEGGIVTKPTVTEYGLVGEAGTEAMIPSANGSMGIFPLSNRRYVRPFARAVAEEMGGGGGSTVVNNYSIGEITYSDGSAIAGHVESIFDEAAHLIKAGA